MADDHYLVREGVRSLLEAEPELEVAAVCEDLDSLLGAVDAERPDVVVTDIRMPPGNTDEGIQAAERLRETHPGVGVVVLSQYATPSYALALLDRGSAGRAYLLKERVEDVEQLVAAIQTVAEGGSMIDPKVVDALVAENARSEDSPLNELTPRERDVLREMAEGKNNAAIAESLVLTERSVEKVIHSIFLKLGLTWETAVHRRVKAVILYSAAERLPPIPHRGETLVGRFEACVICNDLERERPVLFADGDRRCRSVVEGLERHDAAEVDGRGHLRG
jgi:DNA-binding NarL/FixJ family response regulator